MIGYRDLYAAGASVISLDRVELAFGEDGILRDPSEEQIAVLERDGVRRERFIRVELEPESTGVETAVESVAVSDTPTELAAPSAAEEPSGEGADAGSEGGGRRRRRISEPPKEPSDV